MKHNFKKMSDEELVALQETADEKTLAAIEAELESRAAAAAEGCKLKLIAHASLKEDGSVEASVAPEKISVSHPLAGVSNEFNAVYITGDMVGELMFYGKGAGALPTGSAIVGDIISVAKSL